MRRKGRKRGGRVGSSHRRREVGGVQEGFDNKVEDEQEQEEEERIDLNEEDDGVDGRDERRCRD